MNIIARIRGESFLIDVVTLSKCNHQTVSQACIRGLTHVDIEFEKFIVFVTDSTAYCKKAHREVVSFSKSNKYLEAHPCITFTRQFVYLIPYITHDIDSSAAIKDFQDPSTELVEEF